MTSGSVTHSVSGIISQVFLRAFDLVADDTLRGGEPINDPINDPITQITNSCLNVLLAESKGVWTWRRSDVRRRRWVCPR